MAAKPVRPTTRARSALDHRRGRPSAGVGTGARRPDIDVVSQDASRATLAHSTLHARFQTDDHAAPGLVVLPDRRIAVFYSRHARGAMLFRISAHPEDITAFGPEQTVPTNVVGDRATTYGNPIYLSAEHRLYLFFRGAGNLPVMTWTHDYRHWSQAVNVAVSDDVGNGARPYVKYATNGVDTIVITFTDGHPREVPHNSVYEMVYKAGVLRTPDGTAVSVLNPSAVTGKGPHAPHSGTVHTDWLREGAHSGLVYDDHPGGAPAWAESSALDSAGELEVVYSTYQDVHNAPYYYARWDGTKWTTKRIADGGGSIYPTEAQYSGGADIDRSNPGSVFVSRETSPGSGRWELGEWTLASATVIPVTQHSGVKNIRPVVPWGPPGDIKVLWMSGRYTNFSTGYHTQLREMTTSLAPTSVRISSSAASLAPGATARVGARVVQGYNGAGVPGVSVRLVGKVSGHAAKVEQALRTDATGLATFSVRETDTTAFSVRTSETATYGASTSPSVVITASHPSAVRISTSATTILRAHPVTVGMRAVDAAARANIPHAKLELWQAVAGHPFGRVGTYIADVNGLVRTVRRPSISVTYEARIVASATHLPATSARATVRVG